LNHLERVLLALSRKEPDRVPIDIGGPVSSIHVLAYRDLTKFLGMNTSPVIKDRIQQIVDPDETLLRRFDVDFRHVSLRPPDSWRFREFEDPSGRSAFVDEWGIKWGRGPYYYDMIDHPLRNATIAELETFQWPNPADPGRTRGLEKEAKILRETTDFAIVADSIYGGLFETAWWLRGFEKLMVDFYKNIEFVEVLLDRLLELFKSFYTEFLRSVGGYVHVVQFGDDYAMQTGPIVSPQLFRRFIKPGLKELYDHIHQTTKAKIFHHSCGSVRALIPDLIEAGVDILNPVQPSAANMEPESLKRDFGSSICFHGGLDVQRLLPFENAENISREAEKVAETLGAGGGYVFASAHNMQAFTPPENICAAFDSVRLGRHV